MCGPVRLARGGKKCIIGVAGLVGLDLFGVGNIWADRD